MKKLFRNLMLSGAFAVAGGLVPSSFEATVQACPGCKNANETDERRPKAYMYSILFMLGMPAMVFTGFSVAFYRLSKKAEAAQLAEQAAAAAAENDQSV